MERIKPTIFIVFFTLAFCHSKAQYYNDTFISENIYEDTIYCGKDSFIINVPKISKKQKIYFQYEEGMFVTYPFFDTTYLFIHIGYNVTTPFCDTNKVRLTTNNDSLICYYGADGELFTKEIFNKKTGVTISYVNVKEEELPLFDSILSSLKMLPYRNKH